MLSEVHAEVDRFARETFFYAGPPLGRHVSLIDSGVIDSTGVLELVSFLEQRFAVSIDDAEVSPDHLDTIARIESLLERKRRRQRDAPPVHHPDSLGLSP